MGDGITGIALLFEDLDAKAGGTLAEGITLGRALDRLSAGLSDTHGCELLFPMFPEHIGAQVIGMNGERLGEKFAKADGIDECAGAKNALGRKSGQLEGQPRERINGVGDDDQLAVRGDAGERW